MSANRFENQVQQKMDELRLQPTAQVWEEVERRIREKKRRRIIVFWFLFAGLLLSGGGWWIISNRHENKMAVASEKNEIKRNDKELVSDQKDNDPLKNEENKNTERTTNRTDTIKTIGLQRREEKSIRSVENNIISQIKTKRIYNKTSTKGNKEDIANETNNKVVDEPATKNEDNKNPKMQGDLNALPAIKTIDSKEAIAIDDKQDTKKTDDSLQKNSSLVEPVVKKKDQKKNKWETALSFSIGSTRLTNGKLGSFGQKSLDVYSSPSTSTGGSYPPISHADSIPLKGINLLFGVSAKRKLGKRTAFSAGLSFSFYSTKQQTGSFKDSSLTINNSLLSQTSNGFYQSGSLNTYHNKYYYLQIPLLLHWQINKGSKFLPLNWENGFAPSVLVGSNALAYDRSTRIFYKDKRVFNSFNLVYQTGLSARLVKDKKHPLNMGLYYNYHFSRLQKIAPPNYNYLSSYGIKLNWVIKK